MTVSRRTPDVTIVGAGIIGSALAWELTRYDVSVELIDRREIGREASWASAGIISPPGARHGARSDMALSGFRTYPALIEEVEEISGISVGYNPSGQLDLGTDDAEPTLREATAWLDRHGVASELLDAAAIREREPAVREHFTHGLLVPGAGSVLLGQMARALARSAERRGAVVREHIGVNGIVLEGGKATGLRTFDGIRPAGTVVIAAGAWSRLLGESIDLPIPTAPVRGQMLALADPPLPIHSALFSGHGYLVPRADGTVAVGATEEHDAGFDTRVTPAGLAELAGIITRLAPGLAHGRFVNAWAGLRPGSDDGELIVGRVPHAGNVWVATGHFRSGALLAPATAELLSASIIAGRPDPALAPFDPARFVQ